MRLYHAQGEYEKERGEILKAASMWGQRVCKKLSVDLRVEGESKLPEGPVVLVSNHESYGDIPIFFAAIPNKQFGFVAKSDLLKLPLYGKWISEIHSVFLEREDVRSSLRTIDEGIALIEKGFSLAIFPEGTRSKGRPMAAFKKGSLRLATKPGVPIVPVTIKGSWRILEETGTMKKNQTVRLFIHPPIETANLSRQEIHNLSERVENIIRDKLREL
jgi:1-acyl-sn-glycerol-3-phosphate acyltransferase